MRRTLNTFLAKFVETNTDVGNKSRCVSDEEVGDSDHGIGKVKLRIIWYNQEFFLWSIFKFYSYTYFIKIVFCIFETIFILNFSIFTLITS